MEYIVAELHPMNRFASNLFHKIDNLPENQPGKENISSLLLQGYLKVKSLKIWLYRSHQGHFKVIILENMQTDCNRLI